MAAMSSTSCAPGREQRSDRRQRSSVVAALGYTSAQLTLGHGVDKGTGGSAAETTQTAVMTPAMVSCVERKAWGPARHGRQGADGSRRGARI